jgi:hypothetical protein
VNFDVTDLLLIKFSAFVRFWEKLEYNETDNIDTIKQNTETLMLVRRLV